MGKDYVVLLDKIEKELTKEERSKGFRKGYHTEKKLMNELTRPVSYLMRSAEEYIKSNKISGMLVSASEPRMQGAVLKIAHDLMQYGIKQGSLDLSLLAAKVYEKLDLGDKESVQRRLVQAVEKSNPESRREYIAGVREFLIHHQNKKEGGLEHRVSGNSSVAIATGFVLLVSFLSSQASVTGFAVQQSASSFSSGWTSIFFFAFIVIAVFYLFHKK